MPPQQRRSDVQDEPGEQSQDAAVGGACPRIQNPASRRTLRPLAPAIDLSQRQLAQRQSLTLGGLGGVRLESHLPAVGPVSWDLEPNAEGPCPGSWPARFHCFWVWLVGVKQQLRQLYTSQVNRNPNG